MRILKSLLLPTLILGGAFILGSCSTPKKWPPPAIHQYEKLEDKSTEINVDVFYDATLSMQGFVNLGITTDYARTVDRIEGSITTGWPNATVTFYRFGTTIRELTGREQKNVVKPAFYNEPDLRGVTSMEKVIDGASTERLTIIVADLFQDDADVTQLVNKLKDRFLPKDLSVGLLGIKSEFRGTVFDVGINRDRFDYDGQRPFYILMIGKHRDIEHLHRSLDIRILNELPTKNFVILSRHFSYPLPSFEKAKVHSKVNTDEITNILPHDSKDSRVKQLRIKSGRSQSQLTLLLPRVRLPYTLDLDPSAFEIKITPHKVQAAELVGNRDTLVTYPDWSNVITTTSEVNDSLIELRLKIDESNLLATGVYIIEQTIHLKDNIDLLPKWVSSWDMNLTKLPDWKHEPTTFEGNTTLNLRKFSLDLFQAIVQTQKPEIAHLFYYIRKE
ncbi:MAG: hypothetical protein V1799_18795 [bacterium]